MSQTTAQAPKKEKVGIGAWIALIFLIIILSGVFRTSDTPLKVLDFTNLSGSFGTIGDTGANFIGSGGSGAKDGFMAGLNLIPAAAASPTMSAPSLWPTSMPVRPASTTPSPAARLCWPSAPSVWAPSSSSSSSAS